MNAGARRWVGALTVVTWSLLAAWAWFDGHGWLAGALGVLALLRARVWVRRDLSPE